MASTRDRPAGGRETPDHARFDEAVPRRRGAGRAADACEFFFAGAGLLPAFLFYVEQPGLAALSCVACLLAAAACGIADPDAPHRKAGPRRRPPD